MALPAELDAWQRLIRCAIDDCDKGWMPGADTALMQALRSNPRSRRLLARRLGRHGASALMSVRGIDAMSALPDCEWMFEDGATLRSRIADLGTLALAPGLRKLVDRSAVQTLRRVLMPERYSWLMACDPDIDTAIGDVHQLKGWRHVDRYLGDNARLLELVTTRGLHEIGGALSGAPILIQQRIDLLYAPGARGGPADAWLPPGRALRLLRSGGSDAPVADISSSIAATAEAV
jgi:hypothetical protein